MTEFQSKKKRNPMLSGPVLIVLFLIFVWLLVATGRIYMTNLGSKETLAQASAHAAKVKERAERLHDQVEYLSTPAGIESEVRRKFRVVRPGEEVAVFTIRAGNSTTTSPISRPWWTSLFGWGE